MLIKNKRHSIIRNEKGMAVMELIPTLFIYILLINFSLGFFGIVHAGILHSIAARNYAFETMRHRSNLVYHRIYDNRNNFSRTGYRFGGILYDQAKLSDTEWIAPTRPIAFASSFGGNDPRSGVDLSARGLSREPNAVTLHNVNVKNLNEAARNSSVSVSRVWIKSLYGICINSTCGD